MKKKHYKVILLLFFYTLLSSSPIFAEEIKVEEIKIGVFNFQPFYMVEENQEPSGILIDYIKMAFEKCNLSYSIKGYPPKRLYKYLADGESDIFLGVKGVPELEGNVLYSNEKITEIDLRVYSRKETVPIKTKEEMKGKRILTIRGYSYGGFIQYLENPANNIIPDMTNTHELAFKKLKFERADYLLDYSYPSEKALKSIIIPGIQSHSISLLDVFLIVSQKTPNAQELLTKLEQAFIDLKQEGKLSDL
ncbi:MAG: transporter substrate-binding domain-containing protein [Desulfamplus sp.]|nr:transporter substrate-binding domain-containing protein [Desulfamplus sp.]